MYGVFQIIFYCFSSDSLVRVFACGLEVVFYWLLSASLCDKNENLAHNQISFLLKTKHKVADKTLEQSFVL